MRTGGVHCLFAKTSTPTGNQNLSKVVCDEDDVGVDDAEELVDNPGTTNGT